MHGRAHELVGGKFLVRVAPVLLPSHEFERLPAVVGGVGHHDARHRRVVALDAGHDVEGARPGEELVIAVHRPCIAVAVAHADGYGRVAAFRKLDAVVLRIGGKLVGG